MKAIKDGTIQDDGTVICKHGEPGRRFQVKKEGKNQGKWFYKCSQMSDQCHLFVWESEVPTSNGNPPATPSSSNNSNQYRSPNSSQTISTPASSPPKRRKPFTADEETTDSEDDFQLVESPSKRQKSNKNQNTNKKKSRIGDDDDDILYGTDDDNLILAANEDQIMGTPKVTPVRQPLPAIRPPKPVPSANDQDPIEDFSPEQTTKSPLAKHQPKFNGFSTPITTPSNAMPLPLSTPSTLRATPSNNSSAMASSPGQASSDAFAQCLEGLGTVLAPVIAKHLEPLKKEFEKTNRLLTAQKKSNEAKDRKIQELQADKKRLEDKIRVLES